MNPSDNQDYIPAELDSRCYYFGKSSTSCPSVGESVLLTDLPAHKAVFSRIGMAIFVLTMAYQGAAVCSPCSLLLSRPPLPKLGGMRGF